MRNGSFATWSGFKHKRLEVSIRHREPKWLQGKTPTMFQTHLVIDEYLHWVVSPLDEDQLVGLTWNCVGERRAHSGRRVGLEPHAHGEGVHLRQTLLHFSVHVVGSQWERELEFIQGPVVSLTCEEKPTVDFSHFAECRMCVLLIPPPSFFLYVIPNAHIQGIYIGIICYTTNPQA